MVWDFQKQGVTRIAGRQTTAYTGLSVNITGNTFENVSVPHNDSGDKVSSTGEHTIASQGVFGTTKQATRSQALDLPGSIDDRAVKKNFIP